VFAVVGSRLTGGKVNSRWCYVDYIDYFMSVSQPVTQLVTTSSCVSFFMIDQTMTLRWPWVTLACHFSYWNFCMTMKKY